jgi:ABC-type nitrate/sulfonate/bicarbonate transport system substrate-binding protein
MGIKQMTGFSLWSVVPIGKSFKAIVLWFSLAPFGLIFGNYIAASAVFALEPITISYPGPGMFNLPVGIAIQRGFFQEQNLDAKLVLTRSDADRVALASGDVDFSLRGSSVVLAAARGLPVRMIFVGTLKPFWALVVRPEIDSVKQLKGKALGVAGKSGAHHLATRAVLRHHGLDPDKDVVFTIVSIGSRLPALTSGAMDGGLLDYGEAFRAEKNGFKILLNAADYYAVPNWTVGAHTKKLREQPDQVKRLLRASVKGLRYMRENREGALDALVRWLKVDREIARGIYDLSINNFTKDGSVDEALLKGIFDQQLSEAKLKGVPLSQVTDFSYLSQVLKD